MNVNDVPEFTYPKSCWMEGIFARQLELRGKYHHIEEANGFRQPSSIPVNLHDRFDQAVIKDLAWRFTEELAEAHECLLPYYADGAMWYDKPEVHHYREELMDGLHFLTELTLLAGAGAQDLYPTADADFRPSVRMNRWLRLDEELKRETSCPSGVDWLQECAFRVIIPLGVMCNTLKNKPWKNTHQLTDVAAFQSNLRKVWAEFGFLLRESGFTAEGVYDLYIRKNEVNKFRQRSNY
jgi:dimeric dUTPase (all-alpha-NTP-PPase superfamily)